MARLIKLKAGKGGNMEYTHYNITESLNCGDGYKMGVSHKFEGTEEQVTLLVEILKKFRLCTISNITKNSFIFSSDTIREQIFSFRICRFIRNKTFTQVLKDTLMINTQYKVIIPNAFVIAMHLNRYKLTYYSGNMDILYFKNDAVNFGFKSYDEFINHFKKKWKSNFFIYNHIFYPERYGFYTPEGKTIYSNTSLKMQLERYDKFTTALKNKKYKVASNLISERL